MVDADALGGFEPIRIIPAGDDAGIAAAAHIARERVADDHDLRFVNRRDGVEDLIEKRCARFFRAELLGEKYAVHQRAETGQAQLFRLGRDGAVRHGELPHPAAEGADDAVAVITKDDGIAETELVLVVEGRGDRGIQPFGGEKFAEAADQDLVFVDLAALHTLPVARIDGRIAADRLIRTWAEFFKQAADGGALRCVKIQQCAVHIPQDRRDHVPSSVSLLASARCREGPARSRRTAL